MVVSKKAICILAGHRGIKYSLEAEGMADLLQQSKTDLTGILALGASALASES